jgi:hypothetical protein
MNKGVPPGPAKSYELQPPTQQFPMTVQVIVSRKFALTQPERKFLVHPADLSMSSVGAPWEGSSLFGVFVFSSLQAYYFVGFPSSWTAATILR